MNRPRILDLFCGAGGAARGYHDAGFEVVGVDITEQPNYPYKFWKHDALRFLQLDPPQDIPSNFDAIHASPPCQAHSAVTGDKNRDRHPDLVGLTRELLQETGLPYVIENVVGAPLINPIQLCGSSFGKQLRRHRLFECSFDVMAPPCAHGSLVPDAFDVYEHGRWYKAATPKVYGVGGGKASHAWAEVMDIDWMTRKEIVQAIPPYFTEHIGSYLLSHLAAERALIQQGLR